MPLTHPTHAPGVTCFELWKMAFLASFDDSISDTNYFFLDVIVWLRVALGFFFFFLNFSPLLAVIK